LEITKYTVSVYVFIRFWPTLKKKNNTGSESHSPLIPLPIDKEKKATFWGIECRKTPVPADGKAQTGREVAPTQ
jgi:hypothetical protein